MDDRVEPLAVFAAGRYSDAFLRAIDAALAVRPGDRPQTERDFRALLDAGLPTPPADEAHDSGRVPYATIPGTLAPTPAARPASQRGPAPWQAATTAAQPPRSIEPTSPAIASPSRNSAATLLVGGAVVAMVATVSLFAWLQQRSPAPVNASAAASASAAVPAASLASPSLAARARRCAVAVAARALGCVVTAGARALGCIVAAGGRALRCVFAAGHHRRRFAAGGRSQDRSPGRCRAGAANPASDRAGGDRASGRRASDHRRRGGFGRRSRPGATRANAARVAAAARRRESTTSRCRRRLRRAHRR